MRDIGDLVEGELVLVRWADITQSIDGDPTDAELETWRQPGYWIGVRDVATSDGGSVRCAVIAGARTTRGWAEGGWTAIPLDGVLEVVRLVPAPGQAEREQ